MYFQKIKQSQQNIFKILWSETRKHIIYLDATNLYVYATSKFLPTSGFKWIDSTEFYLNKHTSNRLKGCVLEVYLEYAKVLPELRNDYPLATDEIEIKREMLSVIY